ncbi:hypothetical protein GOP47_0000613 [Adiantum capillus-veneris]|uniref:Polyadenylate-binding protein n=1 Tax=Adiantum capillus-veneris TaxID=13818 RepID=A0A9D4ZQP7_ADICA|nr:hypothetical protein GOP47_0000613 [Adiantum capillus-veneris]
MEQIEQEPANPIVPSLPSQSSLYVGDLDLSVKEEELFELFSQAGQVVSIRVNRNSPTSSPYAYVNYTRPEFAQEAHKSLNYSTLRGKQMRIMFLNPDPTQRKSGAANIFVKNLDPLVDNKNLHDTFSGYGPILSCRVATNEAGESKGYGFVQFDQEEAAESAIQNANGMMMFDRQIFVGPFMKKEEREREATTSTTKFNNVYVKHFTDTTTDEDLYRIFGEYGAITSAVVMRDTNGDSKGFGFVNFENSDDAVRAVEGLNGKTIDEKEWYVCRAQKKSERELALKEQHELIARDRLEKLKDVNVYVKHLDSTVDERTLKEWFSAHGHVVSTKIIKTPEGNSRGIGFVTYSSPEEAQKAIAEMNGVKLGSKALFVAKAQRKDDRQVRDGIVSGPRISPPPMYHPGAVLGQQFFYGQPLPGLMPQQANGFNYQQPVMPGMGTGGIHLPNYFMSVGPGFQGPRMGRRGVGGPMTAQQQATSRSNNRRYSQSARYHSDVDNLEFGVTETNSLASSSIELQRAVLGEQLYPLVEQLERERAGKVTGMLLELGQQEVSRLINSREVLKARVSEAMEVLRMAQANTMPPSVDMANLSLNKAPER